MRVLRLLSVLGLSMALLLIPRCKSETATNNTDTGAISTENGTDTSETTTVTVTDTKADTTDTTRGKSGSTLTPARH